VELAWETWNLNAPEPPIFPESGEPEDFVLGQPHSPSAAARLGELWEIVAVPTARIIRPEKMIFPPSIKHFKIDLSTWNGEDLIRSGDYGSILFAEPARDWFAEHWGQYVEFEEFPTT